MELCRPAGHPAARDRKPPQGAVEDWFAREFTKRKVAAPRARAREIVLLLKAPPP